jgi:hypothetical protein
MARRKLTSGSQTDDASAFETEGVQPASNTLVLLFVTSAQPAFPGGLPPVPTVAGNGLVWVPAQTVPFGANTDRRLTCFRTSGTAPLGGSVTIDFGGQTQDFCAWSMFEYSDIDAGGTSGAAAVAQIGTATATGQSLTAGLSPSADPAHNVAVGAIAVEVTGGATLPVTPGAGFTGIDELDVTEFLAKAATLQTQDAAPPVAAVSWTWGVAQSAGAIALEVKAAPVSSGPTPVPPPSTADEALVKRFEPVLFFHPQEKFFPSDAKRYIEHAALWTAQAPYDDKNDWGGQPGAPFPRKPTVAAMGLAAAPGEPGSFAFDSALGAANDHRFLELGGWKDAKEDPEPNVTDTSANLYADRGAIEALYIGDLEASRFWYHAEVFHHDRLLTAAQSESGLDLTKILNRLTDPTLLCYYLFFPAHQQSVGADSCSGVLSAEEVSCHAGDWQCIAILGEGDGDQFTPKFLGRTGSRPTATEIAGTSQYRAYQFEDDNLTALSVDAWSTDEPQVTDGHPRFYVAAGSHSLYTKPGDQAVDPYPPDQQPSACGGLDNPGVDIPGADQSVSVGVILAKLAAGGILDTLAPTFAAALVSLIIEGWNAATAPFGASFPGDTPDPDHPPAAPGAGKTLRPAGLAVPDAGNDIVDWRSQRALTIDDRTYDCIVDRTAQPWWPSDDTLHGFWGRWGQHVTSDALPRRAGPRFPSYARMFLLALADGDARQLLDLDA